MDTVDSHLRENFIENKFSAKPGFFVVDGHGKLETSGIVADQNYCSPVLGNLVWY